MSSFPKCPKCKDVFGWKANHLDDKAPKLLECGHVMCLGCVKKSPASILCPICQRVELKKGDLSEMLYDVHTIGQCVLNNFEKIRLYKNEVSRKPKKNTKTQPTKVMCSECSEEESSCYCRNCEVALCDACCFNIHSSSNILRKHKITSLPSDFAPSSDLSKYVRGSVVLCTEHKNVVSSYCHDDQQYICSLCSSQHTDHNVEPVKKYINDKLVEIKILFTEAGLVLDFTRKSEKLLKNEWNKVNGQKNMANRRLARYFSYLHSQLQRRESEMKEELDSKFSDKLEVMTTQTAAFRTQIQNIQTLFQEFGEVLAKEPCEMIDVDYITELLNRIKTLPCYVEGLGGMEETVVAGAEIGEDSVKVGSNEDAGVKCGEDFEEGKDLDGLKDKGKEGEDKGIKSEDFEEGKNVDVLKDKAKDGEDEGIKSEESKDDNKEVQEDESKNKGENDDESNNKGENDDESNNKGENDDGLKKEEEKDDGLKKEEVKNEASKKEGEKDDGEKDAKEVEKLASEVKKLALYHNNKLKFQYLSKQEEDEIKHSLDDLVAKATSRTSSLNVVASVFNNISYAEISEEVKLRKFTQAFDGNLDLQGILSGCVPFTKPAPSKAPTTTTNNPIKHQNPANNHAYNPTNNHIYKAIPNNPRMYNPSNNHFYPYQNNNHYPYKANNNNYKNNDNNYGRQFTQGYYNKNKGGKTVKRTDKQPPTPDKMVVRVSHVSTPSSFFVQTLQTCKRLKVINDEINQLCVSGLAAKVPLPPYLQQGVIVFALFTVDSTWYRGRVEKKVEGVGAEVKVFFLDYGNSDTVDVENIRIAPSKFHKLPPLSLWCSLADCTHRGRSWDEESVEAFKKITNLKYLTMMVFDSKSDRRANVVDLVDLGDEGVLRNGVATVKDSMVFLGHASHICPHQYPAYNPHKDKPLERVAPTILPPPSANFTSNITHIDSPYKFYVQTVNKNLTKLHKMMDEMDDVYNNDQAFLYAIACPVIGSICAGQSNKDKRWYRAKVLNLTPPGRVLVFFVDFGYNDLLSVWNIKKLKREFSYLYVQAIECRLVSEISGGDDDSTKQRQRLEEWKEGGYVQFHVHDNKDRLLVQFVQSLGTTVLPPTEGTDVEDSPSDPTQELAISSTTTPPPTTVSTTTHNTTDTTHNNKDIFTDKWSDCHVEAFTTKPDKMDYPPNIPLHSNRVSFCFTHIDHHGTIYCQNAEPGNAGSLNKMMVMLDEESRLTQADPGADWQTDDIACCKYSRDNFFYRVKVISADSIYHTAKVLFVDYGNEEDVTYGDLRPALFIEHPVSCYACSLHGVEWVKEDGVVRMVVLREVKLMLEQLSTNQLNGIIKSDVREDPHNIEVDLFLRDGSCLASHLIMRNLIKIY